MRYLFLVSNRKQLRSLFCHQRDSVPCFISQTFFFFFTKEISINMYSGAYTYWRLFFSLFFWVQKKVWVWQVHLLGSLSSLPAPVTGACPMRRWLRIQTVIKLLYLMSVSMTLVILLTLHNVLGCFMDLKNCVGHSRI